jgi:hypothetical protein
MPKKLRIESVIGPYRVTYARVRSARRRVSVLVGVTVPDVVRDSAPGESGGMALPTVGRYSLLFSETDGG